MCVAEKVAYICAMIFSRIRARLRLSRIRKKQFESALESALEEYKKFKEYVSGLTKHGDRERSARNNNGHNAQPESD